ncbi:MAG: pyridoxal phosphate-dependent aminotransferase [Gemmatimonadaceae bacterium]
MRVTRACYGDISLYSPGPAGCRIDLSDNTNLWGFPPVAAREIGRADAETVTRYPQAYSALLKGALSEYLGVPAAMVVTGCGSDDTLDSAIRAFAEPGELLAHPDPTFPMISRFARMNGVVSVAVPLTSSYDVDVDAMLATGARIIYVCSPNNPTGTLVTRAAIEAILAGAGAGDQIVIVDEAYAEYSGESVIDLVASSERLLVVRTMSKAFGLAGLRVGYAVGAPALVAEVEKSRGPYKVNALASRAAVAALGEGLEWVREHVALTIDHRARLTSEFQGRGLSPIPSAANFVLVPVRGAPAIARNMRERGIAVRCFEKLPQLSGALAESDGAALRFSIGPWELLCEALIAFDAARSECE